MIPLEISQRQETRFSYLKEVIISGKNGERFFWKVMIFVFRRDE